MQVLIVDDEAENIRSLVRYLTDASPDWRIISASDSQSAETLIKSNDIDVVITDLVMVTEVDGMAVLQMAKKKDPLIMVIVVTAFERHLERHKAFELGAFDCVQKNTPGLVAAEEIFYKTKAAFQFRALALEQIAVRQHLNFLRRYFDPSVFEAIKQDNSNLDTKRKIVTICFWDIRGFSRLCETLKEHPNLIVEFLREYSQCAAEVIFENHGVLDKFIGDGVMALFGPFSGNGDDGKTDSTNAVNAALELRKRFGVLLEKWCANWALYTAQTIDIGLGCGIHTGEVLLGNVGTPIRDQYTALGPHVNFAQRLEANCPKGQIIVSGTTEARVKGKYPTQENANLSTIKNIAGEFKTFTIG
jgi:adenylate cyclase